MAPPHYSKALIGLLQSLGRNQRDIAARLDAWPSAVSSWALGKAPVPKHYEPALWGFVEEVLVEQEARYGRDSAEVHASLEWVEGWTRELDTYTQRFETEFATHLKTLYELRGKSLRSVPVAERDKYQLALMHLDRLFNYLRAAGEPIHDRTEGPHGGSAVVLFRLVCELCQEDSGGASSD